MLFIVGTPIGNLEDVSYRQAQTLANADVILAEDTRTTGILFDRIKKMFQVEFKPNQKIMSFHKDNEFERLPGVLELIDQELNIALISQAGMPIINDPGSFLVRTLVKREIPFTVIPGLSAVTTALLHAGFEFKEFYFLGFLPKKASELSHVFEWIKEIKTKRSKVAYVFFESPNRIKETLRCLSKILPESSVCVTRELTKKFEEIARGTPAELSEREYRGEVTVVLQP